jgi:tetratricopeptide (TPR) repeat protein
MNANMNELDANKRCPNCGKRPAVFQRCAACRCIEYCSKECQKQNWPVHKANCKVIVPLLNDAKIMVIPGSDQMLELRHRGTSDGSPLRLNPEAERLAVEARKLKQSGRYDKAIAMYTECLELDPFNHWYSFHRGETFMLADVYNGSIEDAKYTILLDPKCECAWTMLIRSYIDTGDLEAAELTNNNALQFFPRSAERYRYFKHFKSDITQKSTKRLGGVVIDVADFKDEIFYFYTKGFVKNYQVEFLAIDLPFHLGDPYSQRILKFIIKEKMKEGSESLALGDVFQTPTKLWISPIPVTNKKDRVKIFTHLMTSSDPSSKVVVLKVDSCKKAPSALTDEQAQAYISQIVKNAHEVQTRYNRGEKLIAE